ncbi:MAG: hypothetical protein IKZ44_09760 [Clostridia bacterium]|nr:hypothetical protein [Clostridia bacterium]
MKRTCKILSLLLVAVMALALLPSTAKADPPAGDTHLHSWVVISNKKPTCTEKGKKTWRCTACGETYTETYKALGHAPVTVAGKTATCTQTGLTDGQKCSRCGAVLKKQETIAKLGHNWDSGKVTKAATCEHDGVRTYTCSRCKATYTKAIAALGHDWDEGAVTTEPHLFTPGVRTYTCKRDHSHTYTEEIDPSPWLFATLSGVTIDFTTFDLATKDLTPLTITEQPVGGSITRWEDETAHLTCAATGGVGDYTYEWYSKKMYKLWGWNWPNYYGEQTEPDFDAPDGDYKYWCVVTDSAGNTASTDYAEITYKVRIAKQPDDVNLQSENTSFYCEAEDGSGSYTYRWYDSDMGILGEGQSLPATEHGICYCYCIVTDDVTGETAISEYCEVYSETPFRLVSISEDCELVPGASAELIASFADGTKDYEIWWDKDGTAIDSVEGTDAEGNVISYVDTAEAGVYTVHGVDAHGETVKASVIRTDEKLTITEQPVGGTIPKNDSLPISVTVSGGEAPYTYILYRNGEEYRKDSGYPGYCLFSIWYPGNYYYHIEDSRGISVDSDVVTFEGPEFRIKSQTLAGEIWDADTPIYPGVTVEGGIEPYTYTWLYLHGATWYKVGYNDNSLKVTTPGSYKCRVTDGIGTKVESKVIPITYTASKPRIVQQPKGGVIEEGESIRLSCSAISAHEVRYDWYYVTTGARRVRNLYKSDTQQIEVTNPRIYLCRVTDLVTGEFVESERVSVANPMKLENIYADDYAVERYPGVIIEDHGSYTFHLKITGGSPEYKVVVYAKDFGVVDRALQPNAGVDVICKIEYIENTKEAKHFTIALPKGYQAVNPYWEGKQLSYTYYHYYFVITDASGQRVESKVFD